MFFRRIFLVWFTFRFPKFRCFFSKARIACANGSALVVSVDVVCWGGGGVDFPWVVDDVDCCCDWISVTDGIFDSSNINEWSSEKQK